MCFFFKGKYYSRREYARHTKLADGKKKTTKVPHIYGTPPHQKTQPKTKQASNNLMSIRVFVSEWVELQLLLITSQSNEY